MIKKIILHNFMAHGHSEILLAEGVTVLTGPNNTGKSAVVEALRCLSENPSSGKAFIRHGAKQATVTVELEDGTQLRWHRKANTSWYEIDRPGRPEGTEPETFYKTGQGKTPPEVLDLLQIRPVDIDGKNEVDVHLGDQRSPVFLIDRPAGQVAHFFAASSEGAHLLAMQDLLKTKVKDAKKERQALQLRQEAERGVLTRLAPLPALALALEQAEAEEAALTAQAAALPALARRLDQLRILQAHRVRLAARGEALRALLAPPALEPVDRLARSLARREALATARLRTMQRREALDPLASPPELTPVRALARLVETKRGLRARSVHLSGKIAQLRPLAEPPALLEVRALARWLQQREALQRRQLALAGRAQAVSELSPPPQLEDAARPAALCARLRELRGLRAAAIGRVAVLAQAAEPPALLPAQPLAALLETQARLLAQRAQAQRTVQAAHASLTARQEAIAIRLEALGHCPTCGQGLSRATVREFLEGGHAH